MQVSEVASGVCCVEGGNRVRGSVLDHTLSYLVPYLKVCCEHDVNCDLCVCYSLRYSTGGGLWST